MGSYLVENIKWCSSVLGKLTHRDVPSLVWGVKEVTGLDTPFLGAYDMDSNVMYVTITGHRTFRNLTTTVIHEYVHYLQDIRDNSNMVHRWDSCEYWDSYEIEAESTALQYSDECAYVCGQKVKEKHNL
jgi:hypothetical protein